MSFLASLALAYVTMLVAILWLENRIVFIPDRKLTETPKDHGAPFEDVLAAGADGVTLHGWWLPAKEAKASLLFMHGNAGNISDRADNAVKLTRLGLNVLLFDYRGYGRSEGTPTEDGVYRDAETMLGALLSRPQVDPGRVVYFGRSLGAAVAIDLAVRRPPRALIAESPFCSIRDMAWSVFPYSLFAPFIPRHFDNVTKAASLKCPTLVIHGHSDEVIPFEHGRRVFAAAPEPKRFHDKGGYHNNFYGTDEPAYFAALKSFLDSLP